MDAVLQRPWTEEAEDYARYKRFKKDAREKRHEDARKIVETRPGCLLSGGDGTVELVEGLGHQQEVDLGGVEGDPRLQVLHPVARLADEGQGGGQVVGTVEHAHGLDGHAPDGRDRA